MARHASVAAVRPIKPAPDPQALARFLDNKFGMFLHWGPITLRGTEIGWSRAASAVPIADYDNLYKEFNPLLFDADLWIKTARKQV